VEGHQHHTAGSGPDAPTRLGEVVTVHGVAGRAGGDWPDGWVGGAVPEPQIRDANQKATELLWTFPQHVFGFTVR